MYSQLTADGADVITRRRAEGRSVWKCSPCFCSDSRRFHSPFFVLGGTSRSTAHASQG